MDWIGLHINHRKQARESQLIITAMHLQINHIVASDGIRCVEIMAKDGQEPAGGMTIVLRCRCKRCLLRRTHN